MLLSAILSTATACSSTPAGTDTVPCISLKPVCRQEGDSVSPATREVLTDNNIAYAVACGVKPEDLCP